MKNNWKLPILFAFFIFLLVGSTTKVIFAAENQIHKNGKQLYEVTLPTGWNTAAQQNSEVFFSPKKDVVVLIHWETIPRSDSYGTYLLDEINENEQEIFKNEVESSFKESMSSVALIQSEYVRMSNGHRVFRLMVNDKEGPVTATILVRGNQTFFIVGRAESEELFHSNKEVIRRITDSFKIR